MKNSSPPSEQGRRLISALLVVVCTLAAPAWAGPREDADRLYQKSLITDDLSALTLLRRAIAIEPDHLPAHFRMGWLFQKMNRHDEAIRSYETVVRIQSCNAKAWNNMGNARLDKGEKALAQTDYETALKCDPKLFLAAYNLGSLAYDAADLTKAEALFRRALELEPKHARALHNLAVVLIDERRQGGVKADEALTLIDRAVDLETANPLFRYTKARVLLFLGRKTDAKAELSRAERLTKSDSALLSKIRRMAAEINQTL